jgi:hypothetical protein
MSRIGEIQEVPPKFDEEGNPVTIEEGSKTGASSAPTLKDLIKRLEKLMAENNKLRRKVKKRRQRETLPQVKMKTPHLKRLSPRKGGKEETIAISLPIIQCLSIMIVYLALSLTLP